MIRVWKAKTMVPPSSAWPNHINHVAIKATLKSSCSQPIEKEILLHRTLNHPNIVKLIDVMEDSEYVYLVEEFCESGELFENISTYYSFFIFHNIYMIFSS